MARWYGKIGFVDTEETSPGIWENKTTTYFYTGDLLYDYKKREQSNSGVNDNITLSHKLSIIADPYAIRNCSLMAYAEIWGSKWKITDIEVQSPRLILTVGGVYNG